MKCYYHINSDVSGQCNCGKYLCHECISQLTKPVCYHCVVKPLIREREEYIAIQKRKYSSYNNAIFYTVYLTIMLFFAFFFIYPTVYAWIPNIIICYWCASFCISVSGLWIKHAPVIRTPTAEISADAQAVIDEIRESRIYVESPSEDRLFILIGAFIPLMLLCIIIGPYVVIRMRYSKKEFQKFLNEKIDLPIKFDKSVPDDRLVIKLD